MAILHPGPLARILAGEKTVESRFSRNHIPPFGVVHAGDRILLKRSGGAVIAEARAASVHEFHRLTPDEVDRLRLEWDDRILGDDEYWQRKRGARFGTLIELTEVRSLASPLPPLPRSRGTAWFVLE